MSIMGWKFYATFEGMFAAIGLKVFFSLNLQNKKYVQSTKTTF